MPQDKRGVDRGRCENCPDCIEFEPSPENARCDYCDCAPTQHFERSTQTSGGQGHGDYITQPWGNEYPNRPLPGHHQWHGGQTGVVHEYMHPNLHPVHSTGHARNIDWEYHDQRRNTSQQFQRGISENARHPNPHGRNIANARSEGYFYRETDTHQPLHVGGSQMPHPDSGYGQGFSRPSRVEHHGRAKPDSYSIDHRSGASTQSRENVHQQQLLTGIPVDPEKEQLRKQNEELKKELSLRKLEDDNARLRAQLDAYRSESHTTHTSVAGNKMTLDTSASMSVSHIGKSVQPIPGWRQPVEVPITHGLVELEKNQASAEVEPQLDQNPSGGEQDDSNLELYNPPEANYEESPRRSRMVTIEQSSKDIPTGPKGFETRGATISSASKNSFAKIAEKSIVVKDHMNELEEEMEEVHLQDSSSNGTSSDIELPDSKAEMEEEQMQTPKFKKAQSKEGQSTPTVHLHTKKRDKDKREHLTASLDDPQSGYEGEQCHTFNSRCHGKNIRIENNGTSARSNHTFTDGICFSNMVVKVRERIHLKIIESKTFKGSMKIGFTANNPNQINVESLPAHSYPDLAQRPGFWIKPLHDKLAQQGNVITYMVDSSGDVFYSINGEDQGLFFSGVDVSGSLWAVLDIHGSTIAVQFSNEQAVADAASKSIREGDLVKLEVDSVETLTLLQDGHGEVHGMEQAIGDTGEVFRIDKDEDVHVYFPNHERRWCINPAALKMVSRAGAHSSDMVREKDFVMIKTDIDKIKALQVDHGEWIDSMQETLGRIGRVRKVTKGGTIRVRVAGIPTTWTFNDKAVRKINMQQYKTEKAGVCEQGLHYWKKSVANVCKNCHECTSKGRDCALQGSPLRTPGSPCGCRDKDAGCADCGLCRSCAGESDDDSDKNQEKLPREEEEEEDETAEEALGISIGDEVKVDIDAPTFRVLQEKSGFGWNEDMLQVIGTQGKVTGLTGSCVTVSFSSGTSWALVRSCLTKVTTRQQGDKKWMKTGELVQVERKRSKLKELQHRKCGSYARDMDSCIGKTGCVLKVSGDVVKVDVSGRTWEFHPEALYPVVLEHREDLKFTDQLKEGDFVKVDVGVEILQSEQVGHGGFGNNMSQLLEEVGIVHHIDIDGDAVVYYPDGTRWCINPNCLSKVDAKDCGKVDVSAVLEVGDWVKVESDKDRLKDVQEATECIKWQNAYYVTAGKLGQVRQTYPFNDVIRVHIEGRGYPLNPVLLTRATPEDMEKHLGSRDISCVQVTRGSLVKIAVDEEKLRRLQEGHGEYVSGMDKLIGLTGAVQYVDHDGDVIVRFSPRTAIFSPYTLTKVTPDEDTFHVGDIVLIESDEKRFKDLQKPKGHGGYNSEMLSTCGKTGRLLSVINQGRLRVKVEGKAWIFNPDLLTRKGNPGLGTGDWKSATICTKGKHDWSTGRCLVCITCGECTHYGTKCPVRKKAGRTPGSICGCGNGHSGCDDCGCCRRCAGELPVIRKTDNSHIKAQAEGVQADGNLAEDDRQAKKLHAKKPNESSGSSGPTKTADVSVLLEEMGKVIEMMKESRGFDSHTAIKAALEKQCLIPIMDATSTCRKVMGDHLAYIDGAKVFMDYLKFWSPEVSHGNSSLPKKGRELLQKLLIQLTESSFEFCRSVARCGLLEMLVKDLHAFQKMAESKAMLPTMYSFLNILDNCSRVPENKEFFSISGAVDVLKGYLRNKDVKIRVITLSCLAFLVEGDDLHLVRLNVDIAELIISWLKAAVNNLHCITPQGGSPYTALQLVNLLGVMARNDENKHTFVTSGVVDMLIGLIKNGNDGEKEGAILCIKTLAYSAHKHDSIKRELQPKVVEILTDVRYNLQLSAAIRDAAEMVLKILEHRSSKDRDSGPGSISTIKYCDLIIQPGRVGSGGFGYVYKAHHKEWMMDVAVKKLKMPSRESLRLSKEVIEEAKFMHRARNAYRFIVPLYGVCVEEQFTALVMDFMENGSVWDLLSKVKPVPWALKWRILHETILGMNFLHSMDPKIIHHDLKVQNVLLDGDFHAKITDFGLSEYKRGSSSVHDEEGTCGGTVTHIPPEHFKDLDLKAGEKFDVYSFGILIWEVLTGEEPYKNAINSAQIRLHVIAGKRLGMEKIPDPKDHSEELSVIVPIMETCWDQDPKKRPKFKVLAEQVKGVTHKTKHKVSQAIQMVKTQMGKGDDSASHSVKKLFGTALGRPKLEGQ